MNQPPKQGEALKSLENNSSSASFHPFVSPHVSPKELTLKAIFFGSLFAIIFGTCSVYLALRAGFTMGGSISIAVISVGLLNRLAKTTILENNIIQTIGSSGESVAAGIVYRTAGLLFVAEGLQHFHYPQILTLAILSGCFGILFMIPLRRNLIVKEHGTLLYPEGTACAEVLVAGEKQGPAVRPIFWGGALGMSYWMLMKLFGLWKEIPYLLHRAPKAFYPNATITLSVAPEYLGLGYIIGARATSHMMLGSLLNWLVLIPLFSAYPKIATFLKAKDVFTTLRDLGIEFDLTQTLPTAGQIHNAYGKFIAMGAVVFAGTLALIKSFPIIIASVRSAVQSIRHPAVKSEIRTEQDLPVRILLFGVVLLALVVTIFPYIPGRFPMSLVTSVLVIIFSLFFVTVSARFVGVIGYSMEPIGPMMFTTVMASCFIFLLVGWSKSSYHAIVLVIGAIACSAAGNAGAASQDLKTGFLLGATPWKQQLGFIIGVIVSTVIIGGVVILIDHSIPNVTHAIGYNPPGDEPPLYPAPSANMVAVLIESMLNGKVPWALVLLGVLFALGVELLGLSTLSFAAGMYLPATATTAIFCGAIIRWLIVRKEKQTQDHSPPSSQSKESELRPGMLFATGLVAAGAIAGMLLGFFRAFFPKQASWFDLGHSYWKQIEPWGNYIPLLLFLGVGILLYRQAKKS